MRRNYYRYSLRKGLRLKPTPAWFAAKNINRATAVIMAAMLVATLSLQSPLAKSRSAAVNITPVPGQNYMICDMQSQYLTSPWSYDGLASGSQSYTVQDYENLPGYGTTLPPLPSYIANQDPATTAAVIFAPGSTVSNPAYFYPESPVLYFFEGGSYGPIGFQSVSGDQFIGGSAPGYPEPAFNDGGGAGGIGSGNDTYSFSGGSTTLTADANSGDTTIQTAAALPAYSSWLTFADGTTYHIDTSSGTTTTLSSPLSNGELSGTQLWANSNAPIATTSAGAARGDTSITLNTSTIPLVQFGNIMIGNDNYEITSVTGSQSGYTVGVAGLDAPVGANTPVFYNSQAGNVKVQYLDINDDLHSTTGTITMGSGWDVENNNIHDGHSSPGLGVPLYGGDQSTIEYNCLARMGDYGAGGSGTNEKFDYNEVLQSAYAGDPGCGCSGGGKWWGTLNADIVDNAWIEDSIGGDQPTVWLDNGNTGTLIEGNYFYRDAGSAIVNETGFNMKVDDNLFLDDGWGSGTGQPSNGAGAVNLNSSGGINVPGSRYENQILVSNNQFVNDWMGIDIWQSDQRSCLGSGEGWPIDSAYCSGGFPTTDTAAAGGQYYFSHQTDSAHGGYTSVDQAATAGDSTVYTRGPLAIDDQIGFGDPASTTTANRTDVTTFGGSGTVSASTTGFPSSGELRVDTSAAGGGGGFTGAILDYTGTSALSADCNGSAPCFTGVSLKRGTGTLSGPILQVQPYQVMSETCYANDCAVTISPSIASNEAAGTMVTGAGTCPLFATSVATPSSPKAPDADSTSYWDGCQWEARNVSITGNNFVFQPSLIADSAPPEGSGTSTVCSNSNNQACGTNFMAFQSGGTAPFFDFTGGNAMMSSSSFTGCPDWDPGCSADPLANINALASPPAASAGNGETPYNDVWSNNTYSGPWDWNDVYSFSGCNPLPTDGSNAMPSSDCGEVGFAKWQSAWQQDSGSTYNPMVVSLSGLTANQEIHGASQNVTAYEDTLSANSISSTLSVGGTDVTTTTVASSPHTFSLDTLNDNDGPYTLKVTGTDSANNTDSDSVTVYVANGDLNNSNSVDLSDLSIMAAHWNQTDSNYSDGNITGQSTINLSDLSVLSKNWGWHR